MMTGDFLDRREATLVFGASICGLLLYLQVIWHRQHVALVEMVLALAFSFIVFPRGTYFNYVLKQDGSMPTTVLQLILACLISQALVSQFVRNSRNPEVTACTTVANILTRSSLALCALQGILHVKSLSSFSCLVTLAVLLPLVVGDIIHLFYMHINYGGTIGDPTSWYISNDAMLTFLLGGISLTFPNLLCRNMDDATVLFIKALGFMIIGQSLLSFSALCFREKEDAKAVLKAKAIMHSLCFVASASSYIIDPTFWNDSHPIYLMLLSGGLLYNAVHIFIDESRE